VDRASTLVSGAALLSSAVIENVKLRRLMNDARHSTSVDVTISTTVCVVRAWLIADLPPKLRRQKIVIGAE